MSRGPGRVERAIKAAFDAEPTRVFTTEYLCTHVYAGATKIEKKHRVSLIRAAKRVLQREHNWRMTRTHMPGAPFLFFNGTVAEHAEIGGPQGFRHIPSDTRHAPMLARADEMKV
ncbi:MAG TPA: hypothetical protein VG328_12980 [Stellaceae bacterium]|jgi:hypothetical protein|nr:hypothetical protein [Stellaceae bacterium]